MTGDTALFLCPERAADSRLTRIAGISALVSAPIGVFGIAMLVAFYATFLRTGGGARLGMLNDAAVAAQYALMLPIAVALWRVLRLGRPRVALLALVIGLAGMLTVIVLQLLLVLGVIPFQTQILFVSAGFLTTLVWFVVSTRMDGDGDMLPRSMPLAVLAGLYVGYPVWAWKVGRRLSGR